MKAITITADGTLMWEEHKRTHLQSGQIRIKIAATAINRADLLQRKGLYPPPEGYSDIPGLECAGEVIETAVDVTGFSEGDRVCALLAAGGYATEVVCDARQVLPVPSNMSEVEAAAIPEAFTTAWLNLFRIGELAPKEKVLIKAGASGVGTAAIQLCKSHNNPVCVVVGSDEKIERCIELGAEAGINRHTQSLEQLQANGPFDLVLDPVTGETLSETLKLLNDDGRIMLIGVMGGLEAKVNLGHMLVKRQTVRGSTLRSLSVVRKHQILRDMHQKLWPLFESCEVEPVVDAVFSISDVEDAFSLVESNNTFGKVVLKVS